jgi:hypothetical protein
VVIVPARRTLVLAVVLVVVSGVRPGHGAELSTWDRAYDQATRTRFIPVEQPDTVKQGAAMEREPAGRTVY